MVLMIVVVDYGMGNLRSVSKALESLGAGVRVSKDPADVARAEKLILPGVGAFPAAMRELSARGLIEPIKTFIASGKPYLGICLGLQLLFDRSEEGEGAAGLGVLPGTVKRFFANGGTQAPRHPGTVLKVPHMGWNQVQRPATSDQQPSRCPLLKDVPEGSFFYFVHSYYVQPKDPTVVALETDYGGPFAAMVWRDRLFATQFHPEKSQTVGLALLKNFLAL
jgi:glutamine amidotransferase